MATLRSLPRQNLAICEREAALRRFHAAARSIFAGLSLRLFQSDAPHALCPVSESSIGTPFVAAAPIASRPLPWTAARFGMQPASRLSGIYERCAQLGYTSDGLTASHALHAPSYSADALQRSQVLLPVAGANSRYHLLGKLQPKISRFTFHSVSGANSI